MKYTIGFVLNIVLCFIEALGVDLINILYPISHFDEIVGGTLRISLLIGLVFRLLYMIFFHLRVRKYVSYAYLFIIILYWASCYADFPKRFVVYMGISMICYFLYTIILTYLFKEKHQ